jgi:Cu+-exporting ATPase
LAQARLNGNSVAVVAIDGIACALFEVGDSIKSDAKDAIQMLRDEGIESWLLTGDQENAAHHIAELAGISSKNVISLATPERKLSKIKELRANGAKVLFIGDGVNDAAAMAESDLSMAMGTGTDTAIATADITLMKASLKSALAALALSKKTLRIIRGNLFWALIYNVILIPIAAAGLLNPMLASAAMAASSLFVVFNSLRLSRDTNLPA